MPPHSISKKDQRAASHASGSRNLPHVCAPLPVHLGSKTGLGPQFAVGNVSYDANAKTLQDLGIVCYELDPGNVCFGPDKFDAQHEFDTIVHDAVELKSFHHVLGGFAAINYPTFFHHPKVRVWREQIFARALQLELFDPNMYVAMGFDRMLFRLPSQAPGAESMHRDISPLDTKGDIYGGWFNMTTESQFIRCAPGTHNDDPKGGGAGFAKITDDAEKLRYKGLMQTIEIKPLHVMMFNQKLVHEILAKKSKHTQIRLFMNFYTTDSKLDVLHGSTVLTDVFDRQSVPLLPSAQTCRSFPACYSNYPRNYDSLTKHCKETFHDAVNHDVVAHYTDPVTKQPAQTTVVRPGRMQKTNNGKEKFVAEFPSLHEMSAMLPPYTPLERQAYFPNHTHWLYTIGQGNNRASHNVYPTIDID